MTYSERVAFLKKIKELDDKYKNEMDALWIHIRNLEEKLLNPQEYTSGK